MDKWKGRVVLVSGASSGIGAAICENLVKNGMKVVGAARRVERMQDMAEKLKNEEGVFLPVKCDITKDEDVYALFDKIKDTFGGVDVCVNNAGIPGTGLDLLNGNSEDWRHIFNVNVIAVCLLSKLTVSSLRERGLDDGHIINISSILGHQVPTRADLHFYSGTKYALQAISEGLRQELQAANSGIKLSVVSPGLVKTGVDQNFPEDHPFGKKLWERSAWLKAEDVAESVCQILSAPPYMEVLETIVAARR